MLLLTKNVFALAILFFTFQSHAVCTNKGEVISLKGDIVLHENTMIVCDQAEVFAKDGSRIVTNGYQLILDAEDSTMVLPSKGFDIVCSASDLPGAVHSGCGDIEVHAQTLTGGELRISGTDILVTANSYYNLKAPSFDVAAAGVGHEGKVTIVKNTEETPLADFYRKL
jgi:hypothetical protein